MFLSLVSLANAHRPGLSYARIDAESLTITIAAPELAEKFPLTDLQESRLLIAELTVDRVRVDLGGPCTIEEPVITAVEGDGVEVRSALVCPGGERGLYDAGFLSEMEPGHRHYVEAFGESIAVADIKNQQVEFTSHTGQPGQGGGEVALRFGALGVEHIWTGYDHLLFLLALLITAPSVRAMFFIITGFTVAHSITLSMAALGLVHIPTAIVEPAIALSIAFVGIENYWRPPPRRRVVVTFLLGLIHGFGFAGLLIELGLPGDALALALLSFNGGVELGQAVVVAVAMPILLGLRRFVWWEHAVPVISGLVALMGLGWFVERIL
ncbi:MAG: HupE/UreJ family protein [Myxococcales bacterium]|nr:HupE/UreJ family protein [Myxococcales bacterium]